MGNFSQIDGSKVLYHVVQESPEEAWQSFPLWRCTEATWNGSVSATGELLWARLGTLDMAETHGGMGVGCKRPAHRPGNRHIHPYPPTSCSKSRWKLKSSLTHGRVKVHATTKAAKSAAVFEQPSRVPDHLENRYPLFYWDFWVRSHGSTVA